VIDKIILRFVLGGVIGWIVEDILAPQLPGAWRGVPFRPIYGLGAVLSTKNYIWNLVSVIVIEEFAGEVTDLWSYDDGITRYVKLENSLLFALAMTAIAYIVPYEGEKTPLIKNKTDHA
jgi:uncharacterized membrane protein